MLRDYKDRILIKLKRKCSEVNAELKEVECIYDTALPMFCDSVNVFCRNHSIENPLDSIEKEDKKSKKEISSNFKSLYRKIAIQTHPDKGGQNQDNINKYQQATNAKKDSQIDKLVSIAKDLKINLSELKYRDINLIEESLKDTENKISQIRDTFVWHWFFSNKNKRTDIIARFVYKKV